MANWTGGRLTKAGNDLQIKVEAGLCKLELTKIKLGDGTEGLDAIETMTDLVGPKAVFGISSVVAKDGMCTVTGIISSSNVTAAFYAREWGLFAKDPDRGEILYMISLDPNPESIPPRTAALKQAATYAMNIVVSNAANITAHIDPAGLVTIAILEEYLRRVVGKTDGKLTETLDFANDVGTILRGFMAGDDRFRIYAGRKNHNEGYLEIATADDGSESIVVRQYADQEFKTLVREAKLLDEQGNTSFPGRVSAAEGFAGTADNAARLEGKNLAEIKDFVLEIAAKSFDSKVSKTGDKLTGALDFANDIGTILKGLMGKSDAFRVYAGSTGDENGYLEIATADDGSESIVVRQYGDLGFKTLVREAKLLDEQGNTSFPGRVSAAEGFAGTADSAKEATLANGVSAAVTNHFYRHIGGYETPTITALVDWQLMMIENNGVDSRNIRNAESGVVACDGENTSKSGYGKGCILLKRVYTDFDKILVLACDATGRNCFRQVFDKWELDLMFANSLVFDLARSQSEYWRIMGGKKGTYPGELSYGTVWRTHSKNCGIVEIYGIKY